MEGADAVGMLLGDALGDMDGYSVIGDCVGRDVSGEAVGLEIGEDEGLLVGLEEGDVLGDVVGDVLGLEVGEDDGLLVGLSDGAVVGVVVGDFVGSVRDGNWVGLEVCGTPVGALVGEIVG
jgi:hypothetical protein